VSDAADPTPPLPPDPPSRVWEHRKLSNITLSKQERDRLLESIDRQIAEIDDRSSGGSHSPG